MNTKTKTGILTATLAAAAVLISAQAYANTVASFTRTSFETIEGPAEFVPLDAAGNRFATFTGSGRKVITYTAVCAVINNFTWLEIDISVDGVLLAPTAGNNFDVVCEDFAGNASGWGYRTVQGRTANLSAGTHTVRIRARTGDDATDGILGYSILLVSK